MEESIVLKEFVEQERAVLDPYFGESDTSGYAGLFTGDATYFDPNSSGKLAGHAIVELFAGYAGQVPPWRYEIVDPEVQLIGDAAIFTFNLDTFDADDGSVTLRWNTTEVHRRTADGWEMVHAHWSHREAIG